MDVCIICKERVQDGQAKNTLRDRGAKSINEASIARNDDVVSAPGQVVHQTCRRDYCNIHTIKKHLRCESGDTVSFKPSLRSQDQGFAFNKQCLFCGCDAKISKKKRGHDVFPIRTSDFQQTIHAVCMDRNDDWANTVMSRLAVVNDLHAADAIYHQVCNVNFRTGKCVPSAFTSGKYSKSESSTPGRPINEDREAAFVKVLDYIQEADAQGDLTTVTDLVEKMTEFCDTEHVYSIKHMKRKLKDHFGEQFLIFSEKFGSDVVTLRSSIPSIIHQFHESPKLQDTEAEKLRLIQTAADIIKPDVKCIGYNKTEYQTPKATSSLDENLEFIPKSLRQLLRRIFSEKKSDVKVASIGQAIVQAARPRVIIAPLQIGLATQMHHMFGSKFLLDSLNSHGFCSSYSEVKRYETSAVANQGTQIPGITSEHFMQFVADNADHNSASLDGYNSFHGMGIIAAVTPGTSHQHPIPRCLSKFEDRSIGRIGIKFFQNPQNSIATLVYEALSLDECVDPSWKLDLLWKISWPLRTPRIGWSGFMQAVHSGSHPGKASVVFLPMIDMDASDVNCVYSTLRYVCDEAKRHSVQPILTFDQPLWWKAQLIRASVTTDSDIRSVILKLGGFHIQMSYLGCVGHIMSGSGLQEVLQTVYAPNSVLHMLTGKAVSRAMRGHYLVVSALYALLAAETFNFPLNTTSACNDNTQESISLMPHSNENQEELDMDLSTSQMTLHQVQEDIDTSSPDENMTSQQLRDNGHMDSDLSAALALYDKVLETDVLDKDIDTEEYIDSVAEKLENTKSNLKKFRTAKLWLQYIDMIDLLSRFIKSERTGNWHLHLHTLKEMLPYFAAAGHNLYTKSIQIYLQQMSGLKTQFPRVYDSFINGHHVIRRSDRFWAGLSSDLVIEQVLMRNMKSTGGLTRGRGFTEHQRTQWLLSMPACAEMNEAMQHFTGTNYTTSEQHKEMSEARKNRDTNDASNITTFLQERSPFKSTEHLHSIVTGVVADKSVNSDHAKSIGDHILQSMTGRNALEYTFKKKDRVVTLGEKHLPKVEGEPLHVDPQLLFQRLVTASKSISETPEDIFKYELCGYPSALFESPWLMRPANKPQLAKAILDQTRTQEMTIQPCSDIQYVLDGGAFLQRLPWPRGSTFSSLMDMYTEYVKRKYGTPYIVFDGYMTGPSAKDSTHLRRYGSSVGPEVNFTASTPVVSKKEHFLSNKSNKQKFINMLGQKLSEDGCSVVHADGDADLLIAKTAVQCSLTTPTTVIGEDTDLLVLLCHLIPSCSKGIYLVSEAKQSVKKMKTLDIKMLRSSLGQDVCAALPFVHAVAGCDTTSRLFGVGKGLALKKMQTDSHFKEQAQVFTNDTSSHQDVTIAGEKCIVSLYGGTPGESLNSLRFRRFREKVATSKSSVQVQALPPTAAAAAHHSARVYFQTQQWMDKGVSADPGDWGWKKDGDTLQPILTDLPPAPSNLLKVIRCKCKTDCDSKRCTCRKLGLDCSVACSECKGVNCSNILPVVPVEDES